MENLKDFDLSSLSKEELIKLVLEMMEEKNQIMKSLDETVRKAVASALESNNRKWQEKQNELLRQIQNKNFVIRKNGKELYDTKSEQNKTEPIEINEAEEKAPPKPKGRRKGGKNFAGFDISGHVDYITENKCPELYDENGTLDEDWVIIGTEVTRRFHTIPARFEVEEVRTYRYKNRNTGEIREPFSDHVFGHSPLTPSLAAQIVDDKLGQGVPIKRQAEYITNHGFPVSEQTACGWYMDAGELLHPLYNAIKGYLINDTCHSIHADETTLKVVNDRKMGRINSYIYCYLSSFYDHPVYVYDFSVTRSPLERAIETLGDYKGYLTVDGYKGYNIFKERGVKIQRCWVHSRRLFAKIVQNTKKENLRYSKALLMMNAMDKVFHEEAKIHDLEPDEKKARRNSEGYLTKFDNVKKIADSINPEPNTPLEKAMKYFYDMWPEMGTYLEDGHVDLDNNAAERAIKCFVLDRKAFLFAKTDKGAETTAELFTIVQTAKANLLKSDDYLQWVMENIQKMDIHDLLPWSDKIPANVRIRSQDLVSRDNPEAK